MAQPGQITPSQNFAFQKIILRERPVDRKTVDLASMRIHNAIVEQLVEKALSGTGCRRPPMVALLKP
jgi:hypothetical protein